MFATKCFDDLIFEAFKRIKFDNFFLHPNYANIFIISADCYKKN